VKVGDGRDLKSRECPRVVHNRSAVIALEATSGIDVGRPASSGLVRSGFPLDE